MRVGYQPRKPFVKVVKQYTKRPSLGPCVKCGAQAIDRHHVTYQPPMVEPLCRRCHSNITSLNTHCGWVNKSPLLNHQRISLWKWFLATDFFKTHRRYSKGRAKKLQREHVF